MAESLVSEEDTFKILLATDNHLGFCERDVIRGNDALNTFEEILQIAIRENVDFILLGGDLFHENKPSRKCLHGCFELLRKYCMGDRPVQFEFLSDQSVNFKHNKFPVVNYEDPNLNISIPVFSIHGNHDDPAGTGSYCALDLLSIGGVVNYFGKYTELNNVQISPLLMQKGATKLALYGLGSIRDERLHHMFNQGNISMLRPKENSDDWFNIFVIHQNRAAHGLTNFIPPKFLDEFLDLVIWGHEHECRLTPEEFKTADHKGFYISQPGSSVATSLCPGEAVLKHVGLLQVVKNQFKITNIPLKTVRQFYIENVNLSTSGLDLESPDITKDVMEYCKEKVDALLEKARLERLDKSTPKPPLIRIKVECTDTNEMFNKHSFGQHYVDKVANPKDIVLFNKRRATSSNNEDNFDQEQFQDIFDAASIDQSRVEDLVNDYFDSTEGELQLSLLSETGLSFSMKEFVDKDENHSIDNLVHHQLGKVKNHLQPLDISRNSLDEEITRFTEERKQNQDLEKKEIESVLAESRGKKSSDGAVDVTLSDDDMEQDEDVVSGKGARGRGSQARGRGGARGGRGGARGGRGGKKKTDEDYEIEEPKTQSGRGRGRSSRGGTPRGRGARAGKNTIDVHFKKQTTNGTSKTKGIVFSDSEEELFSSKQNKISGKNNFNENSDSDY